MNRLWTTLYWDIQRQIRNGFYHATAVVAVLAVLLLRLAPDENLAWLLPVLVLGNLTMNTFYFMGGLVLLEKGEGTLAAQVVTPLRTSEYLAAKVISLTLLALLENLLIVVAVYGLAFNMLLLALGLILAAALYVLFGFVVVVRYEAINEYLLPSILYTGLLSLPQITYLFQLKGPLLLHPFQAPLTLMQAAFEPAPAGQILYGVLYALLWLVPVYRLARKAFTRFVVVGPGGD